MNIFKKVAIIFLLGFAAKSPLYSGKEVKTLKQICLEFIFKSIRDDNVSNIWDAFEEMPDECCSKLVNMFYDEVREKSPQLFKLDKKDFKQLELISLIDFDKKFEYGNARRAHGLSVYSDKVKKEWSSLWTSLENKEDFKQVAAYCIKFFNLCLHADDLDQSDKKECLCALLNDQALSSLAKLFSEKWVRFFCTKLMQLCDEFGCLIRVVPKGCDFVFDLLDGDRFSPSLCPYIEVRKDPTLTDFLILQPNDLEHCIVSVHFKNFIGHSVKMQKLLQEIVDPNCSILYTLLDKEQPSCCDIDQQCSLAKDLTSFLNKIPMLVRDSGFFSRSVGRFLGIIIRNMSGIFAIKLELRNGQLSFKVVLWGEVDRTKDVVLDDFLVRAEMFGNDSFLFPLVLSKNPYGSTPCPPDSMVIDPVVLMLFPVQLTKEQARSLFNFFKCWQALSSKNTYKKSCLTTEEIEKLIKKVISGLTSNFALDLKKIENLNALFIKYLIFRLMSEKSERHAGLLDFSSKDQ